MAFSFAGVNKPAFGTASTTSGGATFGGFGTTTTAAPTGKFWYYLFRCFCRNRKYKGGHFRHFLIVRSYVSYSSTTFWALPKQ